MCMRRLRINLGCIRLVRAQEYADRLVKQALARSARREGSPVSDESEDDGPELQYMKQAWAIARVLSVPNGRIESNHLVTHTIGAYAIVIRPHRAAVPSLRTRGVESQAGVPSTREPWHASWTVRACHVHDQV